MRPRSGRGFNRLAVEGALARASALWKRLVPRDYPNGAVIFCSEDVAEVVHPPKPLRRRLYSCGRHFDTSALREALDAERGPVYAVIAIDGSEATLGTVQGLGSASGTAPVITRLGHFTSTTASRTRRGGQSALRFARLRDESELAFLRKVAETAGALLSSTCGVIVAGKADMKRKLLPELSAPLRGRVLCSVDLAGSADVDALRRAALSAAGAVLSSERSRDDIEVNRFFELIATPDDGASLCCYGVAQTAAALKMGAVDELLVAEGCEGQGRTLDEWKDLAAIHGARIVEIVPRSAQAVRFCQSFGIGGFLRWAVDPCLLDEDEAPTMPEHEEPAAPGLVELERLACQRSLDACSSASTHAASALGQKQHQHLDTLLAEPERSAAPAAQHLDTCSASTADTSRDPGAPLSQGEALSWLEAELTEALADPAASEALSACVDVILTDATTPPEEAMTQALAVLAAEGAPEELGADFARRWEGSGKARAALAQ